MALALATNLLRPLACLNGLRPLFGKELRVASRRRRGYALRFAYVLLLLVFIAMVWIPAVQLRGGAMSRAHMQAAARTITLGIVWFQFFGAQLAAIVMLSTAISEEVYGRTLCVLMTTPLSSLQVVLGKFYSRLFQILLLVATSLPLLAIVRVLGGIPWDYLIVSLCVTVATVVFVGSVSLLLSVLCRRAYIVVIAGVLSVAFLFTVVPYIGSILIYGRISQRLVLGTSLYWDPLLLLYRYTDSAMAQRTRVPVSIGHILTCCTLLLAATAGILACSVRLVASLALRRAMGEPSLLDRLRRRHVEEPAAVNENPRAPRRDIRRVVGPPMVWKEMTCMLSRRERFATATVVGIQVLMILIAYSFPALMPFVPYEAAHMAYVWIFLGLASLFTVVASTTVIGREKESHAWPLLLMTPLTDTDILVGKFVGVLRRCGPVWLSLFAYVVAFTWAKCFRPMAVVHVGVMVVSSLLFLSATGFYFGSRCRRTTDAVTANLALAAALWCVLPMVVQTASFGMGANWDTAGSLVFTIVPFGQALAMVATTLDSYVTDVSCFGCARDAGDMARLLLIAMGGYMFVSLAFTWRAVRAFRRRVF